MLHQPFFVSTAPVERSAGPVGATSLDFLYQPCRASLDPSMLSHEIERVPLTVDDGPDTQERRVAALARTSVRPGPLNWAETQELQALYYLTGGLSEFSVKGSYTGLAESPCNRWIFEGPLTLSPVTDEVAQVDVTPLGQPEFAARVWNVSNNTQVDIPTASLGARASTAILQRSVSGLNAAVSNKLSASFDAYWGRFNVPCVVELFSNGYQIFASSGALLASVGGTTGFHASNLTTGFTRCYTGLRSSVIYNDSTDTITFLRNSRTLVVPALVGAFDSSDWWYFCTGTEILDQSGGSIQDLGSPIRSVVQLGQDTYITTDDAVWFWEPTALTCRGLGANDFTNVVASFIVGSELVHLSQFDTSPGNVGALVAGSFNVNTGFIGFEGSALPGTGYVNTVVSYTNQGVAFNFSNGTNQRGLLFRRDPNEIYVTGGSASFETGLCSSPRWLSGGGGTLFYHLLTDSTYLCASVETSAPYFIDLRIVRAVDDAPPFTYLPAYRNTALAIDGWRIHFEDSEYAWNPPDPSSARTPIGIVFRGEDKDPYAVIRTIVRSSAVPSYVDTLERIFFVGTSALTVDCVVAGASTATDFYVPVIAPATIGTNALVRQNHLRGGKDFNARFYLNSRFGSPVAPANWSYDPINHNTSLWTNWDSPVMFRTPSGVFVAKPGLQMSSVERSAGFDGDSFSYTTPCAGVGDLNREVNVSVAPSAFIQSRPVVSHRAVELWLAEFSFTPNQLTRMNLYFSGTQSQVKTEGNQVTIDVSGWETKLQAVVNLSVQYNCVHTFGGIRCGVNPSLHFGVVGSVSSTNPSRVTIAAASLPLPLVNDRYAFGTFRILTGVFAGLEYSVESITGTNQINLAGNIPGNITGETFVLAQGCKKSYAGCIENGNDRYMGFPAVPGAARAYIASTSI